MVESKIHVDGLRKGEQKEQQTIQETVLLQPIVDLQNKFKSDGVSGSSILLIAAHVRW